MILLQVVPKAGIDAYKLLRDKVTHDAQTWYWANKAKTRLRHNSVAHGYIEVASADCVLVAQICPGEPSDAFKLAEKFIGRSVAWFEDALVSINIQFVPDETKAKKRR